MSLRFLLALTILAAQLCCCTAEPSNKATVDELERRHEELMKAMGGSGGSGM
jgi:hypothetical protein